MLNDLKFSFRQLTKSPGFSLASVVVLALGIGLNAAMFSVIYAVAFMGRPYVESDRLMQLYSSQTTQPDSYHAFSYAAYRELAAEREFFAGVLAHNPTLVGVSDRGGDTRRAFADLVSRNYFDVLGAPIVQGRGFSEEEDRPGQDIPVVVATYGYWQRTGFDPHLVGSTIRVNERPYTVIGISARGFTGTMSVFGPDLFFPLGVFSTISDDFEGQARRTLERSDAFNLFLVARLADGVTREAASDRLQAMGRRLEEAFPDQYKDARITLAPLPRVGTSTSPSDESPLRVVGAVLLGLTAAVLLTVSLNLASMLMARGRARRKEFAIRLAIGGGRGRIVRQLLVEGSMLSLAGGAAGVVLALYAVGALVSAFTAAVPITIVLDGGSSPALVVATLFFCVLATLWSALGPALRHSRVDVLADLKPQAGEDVRERRWRFLPRNPLVVAQVSLSVALLIAAGLFVRMAQTAVSVDFGFRADDTVLAEVDGGLAGYSTTQSVGVYAEIERRLSALPGVDAASVGALVPLGMVNIGESVRRAGLNVPPGEKPRTPERGRAFDTPWNAVSGQYFKAMGVAVLDGRTFTDVESFSAEAPKVAILDEALARKLWPEGGAVGQRIEFETSERRPSEPAPSYEVVGIVGSTRRQLFERDLPGAVYVPFAQGAVGNAYFHVRPDVPQAGLRDAVRQTIKTAAPTLPIFSVRTYAAHIGSSLEYWALRLSATLFGTFGVLAVVVALVGIYGVLSHTVSRRTREIGIRLAIGATPGTVIRMILSEGLAMTLAGVGLGWLAGLGGGHLLASLFVDLAPFDPVTFTAIPAAFVAAALAAAWLPARRATMVSPVAALRSD